MKNKKNLYSPKVLQGNFALISAVLVLSSFHFSVAADLVNPAIGITQVIISEKNHDLPANDLVYSGSPQFPSQQEAYHLREDLRVDLSQLEPKVPTDIWLNQSTAADSAKDEALQIKTGDKVNFTGNVMASTGNFKFVVQPQNDSSKSFTLIISRTLHTQLLRKEILRRLGYQIPEMKYLNRIKVQFPSQEIRDQVLIELIPKATTGASSRWCSVRPEVLEQNKDVPCKTVSDSQSLSNPNEVLFQDLVALDSTPVIFNVTSPPINNASFDLVTPSRTLRALAVIYALVNVPESINQLTWYEGRSDAGNIKLILPDIADFSCTMDDAKWILQRIAKLTPADFAAIVNGARYPTAPAKLLTEKLISRRNALLKLFKMSATDLPFNVKIGGIDGLKDGRLTQVDWPDYGSNFAFGEQESPLQNLQYYFYSLAESNVLDNLVSQFNMNLPSIKVSEAAAEHAHELHQQALRQYLMTGQNQQIKFGTWTAPFANGGVDLSRAIVFGSFMGTSQLVQLADTFSYGVNAGLFIGTDGLASNQLLSAMISGSMNINYTHLRPVTDLKTAFKQPMKQIFVPHVMRQISANLADLAAMEKVTEEQQDAINDDMKKLRELLSVGDSLIITQSVRGTQGVSATIGDFTTPLVPQLSIAARTNELVLSRLNIFRKDEATILVFKDRGELVGTGISASILVGFPASFPVLTLTANRVSGNAYTRISNVNISTDLKQNPDFFKSAEGLRSVLRGGSTEILDSIQKPQTLEVQFTDKETALKFFMFAQRTLKTQGHIQVTNSEGEKANYINLVAGKQSGISYQSVLNDVVTYALKRLTKGGTETLTTPLAPNPGQTFFGKSNTRQCELQARTDNGLENASVQVQYKWQGWKINSGDAVKLVSDIGEKYGVKFFDSNFLQDTRDIQLYTFVLNLMVYHDGLTQLISASDETMKQLTDKYHRKLKCGYSKPAGQGSPPDPSDCNHFDLYAHYVKKFKKKDLNVDETASLMMKALSEAEQVLEFQDLISLLGGPSRYYLSAQVSGFRQGSETMSQPIPSMNSPGVQDRTFPQGVLSYLQQLLGIDDGEFKNQWIRGQL